jgi:hypothetical protein
VWNFTEGQITHRPGLVNDMVSPRAIAWSEARQLLVSGADVALWTFLDGEEALEFENANLQNQVTGQVMARVAGGIAPGTLTVIAGISV